MFCLSHNFLNVKISVHICRVKDSFQKSFRHFTIISENDEISYWNTEHRDLQEISGLQKSNMPPKSDELEVAIKKTTSCS